MKRRSILALGGASLALAVAPAVALAAKVSVRVEGAKKTLQQAETVTTPGGSVTRFGAPKGVCPGSSAQGALQAATKGRWGGSYSKTYSEFFITSIFGETPNSKTGYWSILVNNKPASQGACQITLKPTDKLLFAVVPVKGTVKPLGITAPKTATAGKSFTLKAVSYDAKGKASPQAGVAFAGVKGTTNKQGKLTVTESKAGTVTFTGTAKRCIRDETTVKITS
jgi:hypothetical protein